MKLKKKLKRELIQLNNLKKSNLKMGSRLNQTLFQDDIQTAKTYMKKTLNFTSY